MIHFLETILQNPVAAGLSATAVIGSIAYHLRQVPGIILNALLRSFSVELTVDSRDAAFSWVDRWLSTQPCSGRTHTMTLRSSNLSDSELPSENQKWIISPGYGLHWFWWNHRLIVVTRHFEDAKGNSRQPIERFQFRAVSRSQKILRDIVSSAHDLVTQRNLVAIRIWRGWWMAAAGKSPRSIETIILQPGQKERILSDLNWFSMAKDWYVERGIPYRRGYLFSGPPGTGKTSAVLAIASHLKRQVCVLNLGSVEDDDSLFSAIADAPPEAIILIEDIDCAVSAQGREKREGDEDKARGGVTKAGLLNALDGITTPDGRIFIMTTNYPERLDAALIRPGRADVREEFEWLEPAEQKLMGTRFYGENMFTPLTHRVAPAAMQASFMMFPDNPGLARKHLEMKGKNDDLVS
jgi:chaperone BCS1